MGTVAIMTCSQCNKEKPFGDFPNRGRVCHRCLADRETARNEATRRGADRRGELYTSEEDAFIMAHYLTMTDEQIGRTLKRTLEGVRSHRTVTLGLIKESDGGRPGRDQIDLWWFCRRHDIGVLSVEDFDRDGERVLAVYCPEDTPEEAIQGAFMDAGYSTDVFLGWLVNKVRP